MDQSKNKIDQLSIDIFLLDFTKKHFKRFRRILSVLISCGKNVGVRAILEKNTKVEREDLMNM